ncbi:MAG: cell wall-active antibiotics response protein [Ignavibacteriae bacterium]|nr:cell wall-active antibiotics response protein [Ignavibacteriota bacterium]MCI0707912.1 cell wall-active antibiotics response protein [Ignavibacteriota bacterium]
MQTKPKFGFSPQLVMGLIIVIIGTLFMLGNFEILEAREYLRYWPVLLIALGISKLVYSEHGGKLFGFLLTVGGALLLLDRLYVIDFRWSHFWPLILIGFGGSMLWNAMKRRTGGGTLFAGWSEPKETNSTISHIAVMAGIEGSNTSQDFRGGELTAVMGGMEIDLRQAVIKDGDAVIEIFAMWGGIELRVPKEWTVVIEGVPIMGAFEDTTQPPKGGSTQRLIIKGTVVMGGAEIKN